MAKDAAEILRRHYGSQAIEPLSIAKIAEMLDKSPGYVSAHAKRLGLKGHGARLRVLTQSHIDFIRDNAGVMPRRKIAESLGVNVYLVNSAITRFRLARRRYSRTVDVPPVPRHLQKLYTRDPARGERVEQYRQKIATGMRLFE